MEASNLSPTLKQRRKFKRIEETNTKDHQDTSSVNNHKSDLYKGNLHVSSINQKVETLTECCKESPDKRFLQEEKMDFIDSNNVSSVRRNNVNTMNKTILMIIHIAIFVTTIIGCGGSLLLLIYMDHGTLNFIYISDTAKDFPEISFFAQSMNIIAFFGSICLYLRNRVLVQFIQDRGENVISTKMNNISNISSVFVISGISILGNFPVCGITYIVHLIGALSYFLGTVVCTITQTMFTQKMIGIVSDIYIYYLRAIITVIMVLSIFVMIVTGKIAWLYFEGTDVRQWGPNDGGWLMHVISTTTEWIAVLLFSIYVSSLAYEVHRIHIESPVLKIIYHDKKEKEELNSEIVRDTIVQ